jgi:preprotein translocase subunit SecB
MNEQIRLLAVRAGGDFWQRLENDVVVKDAYITFDPPEKLQKFVESIVAECIQEIGYKSVELLDIDFYPHYQERLKNYFGVGK